VEIPCRQGQRGKEQGRRSRLGEKTGKGGILQNGEKSIKKGKGDKSKWNEKGRKPPSPMIGIWSVSAATGDTEKHNNSLEESCRGKARNRNNTTVVIQPGGQQGNWTLSYQTGTIKGKKIFHARPGMTCYVQTDVGGLGGG